MSHILNRVVEVESSDSEAVKAALNAFFQNLPKYKNTDCNPWLRALENTINRFPKYCGSHRPTIESFVSHFLNSNNYFNVIEAAKCAHAVQQVRLAQERTATAKSYWREQMIALCDAAHKLIDAIFAKNSVYGTMRNQNETVLPNSSLHDVLTNIDSLAGNQDNAANKTTILCTRLRNVLVFIQAMLVEIYPVPKPIQPQLILAVILQALSASGSEDSTNVTTIKIQALRSLDALVSCLGSNLIPFSGLVFRFVTQTLKWSSENPSEETRKVRIAAYSSLSKWLDTLHVHCPSAEGQTRVWHDELTAHIISDVTPTKHVMQLTVNAQPMKNLSKKARKKLANAMLMESNIALHMPGEKDKNDLSDESNDALAVAALECAETFLSVCGIFLKTTTQKQFQELLVRECFATTDHSTERAMSLLHALEACRKNCSLKVPPPTQYCLQLYSVLINSPQREVSKFCSQALLDIRLHLHCSPASLSFSLEDQSLKEKAKEEGRKRVSERNRAVLEKLLGIDWMNSEDPTNAIITIPDEPATKKPRVETETVEPEITENVSISSDSVHSVEMSSDSDDESIIEEVDFVGQPIVENVSDSIHNQPTQVYGLDGRDEPAIDLDAVNEPAVGTPVHDELANGDTAIRDETATGSLTSQDEAMQGIKDLAIHDATTQAYPKTNDIIKEAYNKLAETNKADAEVEKIMEYPTNSQNDINEAKTPLLQNSDIIDGKSPISMEVAYDYPNMDKEKVTVLDKMDDENLPSTNDTDDIQITCGQVAKSSQDVDNKNKDGEGEVPKDVMVEIPKVNGTAAGVAFEDEDENTSKTAPNDKAVTVEDMLADFVDEVNEDTPA